MATIESTPLRLPRQSAGIVRGGPSAALRAGIAVEPAFFLTDWLGEVVGGTLEDIIHELPFGDAIYHGLDALGHAL
jgi:hypothetical protein